MHAQLESLTTKFKITIDEDETHATITCRKCQDRWRLRLPAPGEHIRAGTILALLNHHASHD